MDYRLKIADVDFDELKRLVFTDLPKEAAAFALAGIARRADRLDVIARRPIAIPRDLYEVQHELRLEVAPRAINGLIALCQQNALGAILCHSHPEDIPYSASDDHGEGRIFQILRQFIPPEAPTASLLFHPRGIYGRIWVPGSSRPVALSEVVVIGRQITRIRLDGCNSRSPMTPEIHTRQILAFGERGQELIAEAKVGIVGIGGTGSPTAEQLIRLGTSDLVLIDPDCFDPSNRSRVYGTFAADRTKWWRPRARSSRKVEIVAAHLRRINPAARIQVIAKNVVLKDAAARLLDRDVVFLCTDDHWGRAVVNEIAYQYFIPTINMGVRIAAPEQQITSGVGVVDVLRPDQPCLWCSGFLRADRIAAESMAAKDRRSREREGYVEGLDTPTPSIVSVTTGISGLGVTLFLQLLTDFMGNAGSVARLNWDLMDATVRRGRTSQQTPCVCSKVRAFGDLRGLSTVEELSELD